MYSGSVREARKEWEWDAASDLIKDKLFELSGQNNSIITKIDQDEDFKNCMVVGRVMETGTGKHTISMKLDEGSAGYMGEVLCGMVRDGAPCNGWHFGEESTVGWFMDSYNGSLFGNGKEDDDRAGHVGPGQVLTMQVDMDAGTLNFWLDGKPHGPGYTSAVTGHRNLILEICKFNHGESNTWRCGVLFIACWIIFFF